MESKCEIDIERIGSFRQEDSTLRCKTESIQNLCNDVKDKLEVIKANNETFFQPELTRLKEVKDSYMTNLKIVINGTKHDEEVVATLMKLKEEVLKDRIVLEQELNLAGLALSRTDMKSKAINKLVQRGEKTSLTLQTDLRNMEEQCHEMSQNVDQFDARDDDANALQISLHIQLKQHQNVLSQQEKDTDDMAGAIEIARLIYDELVADQTKAEEMRRDAEKEAQHKRRKACTTKDDLDRMKQKL